MATRGAHANTIDRQQISEARGLSDDVWEDYYDQQRDIIHHQPELNDDNTGASLNDRISGYKVAGASRPLDASQILNAQKTVTTALQGQATLGNFRTADPEDRKYRNMTNITGDDGVVQNQGIRYLDSDDPFWEYVARKKALEFEQHYKAFVFQQIDLSKPEKREFWEKKFPEYTKSLREGLKHERIKKARLEDIGLYGVQNEDDMWLLFEEEKKGRNTYSDSQLVASDVSGVNTLFMKNDSMAYHNTRNSSPMTDWSFNNIISGLSSLFTSTYATSLTNPSSTAKNLADL
jgi:hypothetical protein